MQPYYIATAKHPKRITAYLILLCMVLTAFSTLALTSVYAASPAPGSIAISNRAGLEAVRDNLSGTYHLTADIDLDGATWTPIGDEDAPFTGSFDGRGHTIRNLTITGLRQYSGLFGYINGASLNGINLVDAYINVSWHSNSGYNAAVGGICGFSQAGTINNSLFDGYIATDITRASAPFTPSDSLNAATSSGSVFFAGGIVGHNELGSINSCYSIGTIAMTSAVIVPPQSYSHGGGIAGENNGSIRNCFFAGTVSSSKDRADWGNVRAGGIASRNHDEGSISNCYSVGTVSLGHSYSAAFLGAIAGMNNGVVRNSYWPRSNSRENGVGRGTDTSTPLTAEEMKNQSSFAGFDFDTVWGFRAGVNDGYPILLAFYADGATPPVVVSPPVPSEPVEEPPAEPPPTEPPSEQPPTQPTIPSEETVEFRLNLAPIAVGVHITWEEQSGGLGYRAYRSEIAGEQGISVTDFYITDSEFVDVNVESDRIYYYTLRQVLTEARIDGTPETLSGPAMQISVRTGQISEVDGQGEKKVILMTLDDPYMSVQGVRTEVDPGRGTTPTIVNGRTMVPLRAIVENMGGNIGFDDATRKVTMSYGERIVEMTLDSLDITVNGEPQRIDTPPAVINERTMVPVRFTGESLGCQVEWINSTQQIVVVYR